MERREFLRTTSFGFLALSVSGVSCGISDLWTDPDPAKPVFLSELISESEINQIGLAFLRANPHERDIPKLNALIINGVPGKDGPDDSSLSRGKIEQKIKEDFTRGDTVVMIGWVLSRTEARQCALFSLKDQE